MAHDRQPRQASLIPAGPPAPRPLALGGALAFAVCACSSPLSAAPQDAPAEWLPRLRQVLPEGDRFTDRRGDPPVFEAYARDVEAGETLVGYAFLTSDVPPEQKGFNGPIEVLVGMDLGGTLTGIVVTSYFESHRATRGDFLAAEGFQEQFVGKSILDAFQVRGDVDGITGATVTVDAMSRGIRNAAREVALARHPGLVGGASGPRYDPVSIELDELERLTWPEMLLRGLAQRITVLEGERVIADLMLLYLRDEEVAVTLIGPDMWGEVVERAGPGMGEKHLVLAAVDGPSAGALNLGRLSIVPQGDTVGLAPSEVLLFGATRQGKLDGQVRMLRVLLFDATLDMARPSTFVLDLPTLGRFTAEYPGELHRRGSLPFPSGRVVVLLAFLVLTATALVKRRSP